MKIQKTDTEHPAYPVGEFTGIVKYEYFAAMAMQALMPKFNEGEMSLEEVALKAVEAADALVGALNYGVDEAEEDEEVQDEP